MIENEGVRASWTPWNVSGIRSGKAANPRSKDPHFCESCKSESNIKRHLILPISRGGKNNSSNSLLLCHYCNRMLHKLIELSPLTDKEYEILTIPLVRLEYQRRKVIADKLGLDTVYRLPYDRVWLRTIKNNLISLLKDKL